MPKSYNLTKKTRIFIILFTIISDQNFGINELAAIQDVRNDFNLQDITDEPQPVSAALTKDRGKFCFLVLPLLFALQFNI